MFDFLRGFGARRTHSEIEELRSLVEAAKEERTALGALLTVASTSGTQLSQMGASLEHVDRGVAGATAHLDDVSRRMAGLEERSQALDHFERRVNALVEAATRAQEVTAEMFASDGELQTQRRQLQDLSSQTLETQASLAALKHERAGLEGLRHQLQRVEAELARHGENAASVRGEIQQIHGMTSRLTAEYDGLRDGIRSAREDSTATFAAIKDIEALVGPLTHVQALSRSTGEKLESLDALAHHVSQKTTALEGQRHAIDHAVLEASRINEMVWGMDVRIGELNEGMKQAARAEEALRRIQHMTGEIAAQVDCATTMRDTFARDVARFETDGGSLVGVMRGLLERVSLDKQEFETFDRRAHAIRVALEGAEGRVQGLLEKGQYLSLLDQKADQLGRTFSTLQGQADTLSSTQSGLASLHERLTQVAELSRHTAAQHGSLLQSREDLDALRRDVQACHALYADVVELRDGLTDDRTALETFGDRLSLFRAQVPELEATMDELLGKLSRIDDATGAASRLGDLANGLEDQLTRVTSRIQFVDTLEGRVTKLQALSADVDRKLGEQLGRRSELDIVKTRLDGVVTQTMNAWHQIEGLAAAQQRVLLLADRLGALEQHLDRVAEDLRSARLDEAILRAQEARIGDLWQSGNRLAAETTERVGQLEALREELRRSLTAKDELVSQLADVQARQREAMDQSGRVEGRVQQVESLHKALDARRVQLTLVEQTALGVEAKLEALAGRSSDLDTKLKAIGDQQAVVTAVRVEVDAVHQISLRSKNDLQDLLQRREEVTTLRQHVHDLLAKAGETEERVAFLRAHRQTVQDIGSQTQSIISLVDELRVGLETVGEQRVMIDRVAEKLARLEFVTQAAERATQTLQHERDMAERVEQNLKQIRVRVGATSHDRALARA